MLHKHDLQSLSGPQLIEAFNKMVGVANDKGLEYSEVTRFASREAGMRRCEGILVAIQNVGKHNGHEEPAAHNPKPKAAKTHKPKTAHAKGSLEATCELFGVREGSNRKALLVEMFKHLDKPVHIDNLIKAVYGKADPDKHGPVMMVMKGLKVMIEKGDLPFKVERTKDEKGIHFGLYSV